ncbi:unnamed protein product [Chironomus riparius]|uniref:Uncharacterized protein n=1 Tax=Chironomus riparius TaxID=315576 RepID=A0A9P0JAT0_9DIPT|nr:unnamed protein product [Chironomus riparius]
MMKLVFVQILIIFFGVNQINYCKNDRIKWTLNKNLENVVTRSLYSNDKFYKNLNTDCIKEKLKLSENGDKEIFRLESEVLMTKAITSCSEFGAVEFFKNAIRHKPGHSVFDTKSDDLPCTKLNLHKLDPTSCLVKSFNPESMSDDEKEYCDEKTKADDFNTRMMISDAIGVPKIWKGIDYVSNFTCGAFDLMNLRKIVFKMQILWNAEEGQTDEAEIEDFAVILADTVDQVFNCRMSKLSIY